MTIMDCTLRDGANVMGDGFSEELTKLILNCLTENGVRIIERGNHEQLIAEKGKYYQLYTGAFELE